MRDDPFDARVVKHAHDRREPATVRRIGRTDRMAIMPG
jgi:hypothetical protein